MLMLQRNLRLILFGIVWCSASFLVAADNLRVVKLVEREPEQRWDLVVFAPCINEHGDIAFCCSNSAHGGVWLAPKSGSLMRLVEPDTPLPGAADIGESVTQRFDEVVLNDAGQLVFRGSFQRGPNGIWRYDRDRGIELVAREGMVAPGFEPRVFGSIPRRDPGFLLGRSGKVIFFANVTYKDRRPFMGPMGDREDIEPMGYWEETIGGDLTLIAKSSSKNRGFPPALVSNDQGDHVSWSNLSFKAEGLKLHLRGVTVSLLHYEDPFEISHGRRVLLRGLTSVGINNDCQLAILASAADQDGRNGFDAVLRYDVEDGLKPLIFEGMTIPGYDSSKLESNLVPLVNHAGNVAIYARHSNANTPSAVFFCRQGDEPLVVAVTGQPAPGTSQDFVHSDRPRSGPMTSVFSKLVLNARDQIAFVANLSSESSDETENGLWITGPGGKNVTLISRVGAAVEVAPNDRRVVQKLLFAGPSSNEDGAASGMNDRGETAFAVQFTDGSAAVIVSDSLAADAPNDDRETAVADNPIQEGLDQYALWEKIADARLEHLQAEYMDSDSNKLDELARQLKAEYQSVQANLQRLLEDRRDLDEIAYHTKVTALRRRIVQLPMIWQALSERQFQVPTERTVAGDREFSLKTAELLSKYGHHAQIRDQVAAKVQLIESATPPLLEFVPRAQPDAAQRPFAGPFGRGAETLKQFAGSIGPTLPGLAAATSSWVAPPKVIDDGPLLGVREQLSRMVKLEFTTDGHLRFDYNHWTDQSQGLTEMSIQDEVEKMLEERGISEEVLFSERELRRPREFRERLRGHDDAIPARLFDKIADAAAKQSEGRGGRSSGGGGSSGYYRRHFSTDSMRGMLTGSNDYLDMDLEELQDAKRRLSIETNKNGRLRIQIESDNTFAMLLQQPNGALRWITGAGTDTQVRSSEDFAEFYRADAKFVETDVIEFLNGYGILGPVTRHAPEVVSLVIELIRAESPEVAKMAKKAIAELDADQFESRQRAFRQLARHTTLYGPALVAASQDSKLSLESRMQVERLLQFRDERTNDEATVVDALDILDTPEFLQDMMPLVDEESRKLLVARIEQLNEREN